ncbi:ABC transporter permease [Lysobacter aestuarii]|uniref:ABC transporter permease n=2 Tax=Marilutibacter aestuarii TaxID=1706195 RepID=A0A508A3B5_9GAMM|nr:ABC transporter permease [Lysobacter aestuarii]TQD40342.1 ABC transporter permease [Lysobacter aestuarii]
MMDSLSHTVAPARPSRFRAWRLEARCELLRVLRTPSFALPTLLFPPLFYLLFGVVLAAKGGGRPEVAAYLLATYGVFGVMGVGLFGFGVNVAVDRQRGLLTLKRALPMPPGAYVGAKMVSAAVFATVCSLSLALLAATVGGVQLQAWQWLSLVGINVLGVLPFCAIGLWIGSRVGGDGAPAVVNIIYLPMAFLSGLWMPLSMLPDLVARMAPAWPSYHLSQVALRVLGQGEEKPLAMHVGVLLAFTVVFALLALRRLAREA